MSILQLLMCKLKYLVKRVGHTSDVSTNKKNVFGILPLMLKLLLPLPLPLIPIPLTMQREYVGVFLL